MNAWAEFVERRVERGIEEGIIKGKEEERENIINGLIRLSEENGKPITKEEAQEQLKLILGKNA